MQVRIGIGALEQLLRLAAAAEHLEQRIRALAKAAAVSCERGHVLLRAGVRLLPGRLAFKYVRQAPLERRVLFAALRISLLFVLSGYQHTTFFRRCHAPAAGYRCSTNQRGSSKKR